MTYEYPDAFARFYDLIYHQLRDGVDNQFFLDKVKESKGRVLEIGVGTGRFFIDALNADTDIYGIDTSESMIRILLSKLKKAHHYRISLQNMLDFSFDLPFDLIIAPFRVFMHILEKEDHIRALNNVYKYLKPGGSFIFDTFVPDLNQLIQGLDNSMDFEGEYEAGRKLRRIVSTKPDLINQLIHITFNIEWEENDEIKREVWNLPMRFFFRYELEHLIERSDFDHYEILGDFSGNALEARSKEFIMVCKKR